MNSHSLIFFVKCVFDLKQKRNHKLKDKRDEERERECKQTSWEEETETAAGSIDDDMKSYGNVEEPVNVIKPFPVINTIQLHDLLGEKLVNVATC